MQTISLVVSGKVHGVFYRQSTRKKALELGITGTVQNNPDGTVTIIATGPAGQLDKLKEWSKKGPPAAQVQQVEIQAIPLQSFNSFDIKR
ncbi:MAG TPA: acylphosphatase [Chitinophagaceae bacterium]|jgi:acylphosphatase